MERMTLSELEESREKSGRSIPNASPSYRQYDVYKSRRCDSLPPVMSIHHHFSTACQNFSGASLKQLATPDPQSKIIQLATGRPNPENFPWVGMNIEERALIRDHKNPATGDSIHIITKDGGTYSLSSALDYGHAAGSPQLLRFVTEHIELVHNPPYSNWGTCLSSGSTSAIDIALRVFCERGDRILCDHFTYPGFLEAVELAGLGTCGVAMDHEGLRPESLREVLRNWKHKIGKKPSVLYTIPCGQNPTGTTQSRKRREDIYQIAEEHDLIIIEDDPYYFLQLESLVEENDAEEDFLSNLVPSYLSLDTSGRVVRLDSVSKILAPGLRAGWVTAHESIIDKFLSYYEVTTAFVNGPSQLMLYKLLSESWGHRGFVKWLADLSVKYRHRRDVAIEACEKYLPKDCCTWNVPSYGIFLWVDVGTSRNLEDTKAGSLHSRLEQTIAGVALAKGVQVTSQSMFQVAGQREHKVGFRLTYATASEVDLKEGVQRFSEAIKESLCE